MWLKRFNILGNGRTNVCNFCCQLILVGHLRGLLYLADSSSAEDSWTGCLTMWQLLYGEYLNLYRDRI